MYIKKYWGNFIGGSDDSLNLVAFFEDQKKEEIPLSEILPKSDWISRTGTSTRPWSIWNSLTRIFVGYGITVCRGELKEDFP